VWFPTVSGMTRNNSGEPGPDRTGLDDPNLISVRYAKAAEITGLSEKAIQRFVRAGQLVPRYPTRYPVLLVKDLRRFIESASSESPLERSA